MNIRPSGSSGFVIRVTRLLALRSVTRVQGMREVCLLDLSLTGAHIEHLDLFRLGASCALDLPSRFGALSLSAEVG